MHILSQGPHAFGFKCALKLATAFFDTDDLTNTKLKMRT
uniref:Uncharacterized protein n=1 Tax=Nelumbo nucifera TaxID=4432 RepID=A0A822XVC9_NELNU|nr:TPA_asm: hypothetical protein HUJ06_024584 [Nelumbo nucifera]